MRMTRGCVGISGMLRRSASWSWRYASTCGAYRSSRLRRRGSFDIDIVRFPAGSPGWFLGSPWIALVFRRLAVLFIFVLVVGRAFGPSLAQRHQERGFLRRGAVDRLQVGQLLGGHVE